MKIGLHLSMLCKNWTDDTSVYLEELKKEGLQGVEISLYGTTPDRLTKVFSKANALDLDIFCGTGVDGEHDPSSEDPNIRKNALQYLKDCMELFEEYGWDWSYHAFREWAGWSVEHAGSTRKTIRRIGDTDRKQVLLDFLKRNKETHR